jgi:hypothetical protein
MDMLGRRLPFPVSLCEMLARVSTGRFVLRGKRDGKLGVSRQTGPHWLECVCGAVRVSQHVASPSGESFCTTVCLILSGRVCMLGMRGMRLVAFFEGTE